MVEEVWGIKVQTNWWIPQNQFFLIDGGIYIHPWFDLRSMEYRPPFWTRNTLGFKEIERDRRKHR
jgi:hypothetical protein